LGQPKLELTRPIPGWPNRTRSKTGAHEGRWSVVWAGWSASPCFVPPVCPESASRQIVSS